VHTLTKFIIGHSIINDLSAALPFPTRRRQLGRGRFEGTKRPLIAQYAGATIAICATCRHARSILIGCNKTRPLSLMSALRVNSGTSHCAACPAAGRLNGAKRHPRFRRHLCRHEVHMSFGVILRLRAKTTAAIAAATSANAIAPRRPCDLAQRLQSLQDDLEILILGLAAMPSGLHHFKPLNLDAATLRLSLTPQSGLRRRMWISFGYYTSTQKP
jgi:hypothetical protein